MVVGRHIECREGVVEYWRHEGSKNDIQSATETTVRTSE